jgi:hypothetical protein
MKPTTRMKNVMKSPEALAVFDKYIPGTSKDTRLKMAAMMTVEQLLGYVPDFSEEKKVALLADLAKVPED